MGSWVVIGGGGFVGSALVSFLSRRGEDVTVIDRHAPHTLPMSTPDAIRWQKADLLTEVPELPPGRLVLVAGCSTPRPRRPWTLMLENAVATARLAPLLARREVVLLSSIEVYGSAPAPLREDSKVLLPISIDAVESWCDRVEVVAQSPCPPWRAYAICREFAELDPSGRWLYALSKLAQEILVRRVVDAHDLTILRAANIIGAGQTRVLALLTHAALIGAPLHVRRHTTRTFVSLQRVIDALTAPLGGGVYNVGGQHITLTELASVVADELDVRLELKLSDPAVDDSCGIVDDGRLCSRIGAAPDLVTQLSEAVRAIALDDSPLFRPSLPVVMPPRPERPDLVSDRQQAALWSGLLKHGGQWTACIERRLAELLELDASHVVIATGSGTAALRLAIVAAAGPVPEGATALLPSFTFAATGEVLRQLGYRLRFVDVDSKHWTLDPEALDKALTDHGGELVVSIDALGNPADYDQLRRVCRRHGVPLVSDSAPSLGASYNGAPVGVQTDAHAFSMSFAKVVSAAGAGGAVVLPATADVAGLANWLRSSLLHEVHAIAAIDQLDVLDELVARRTKIAAVYDVAASRWAGIVPQHPRDGARHAYVHWVARFDRNSGLDRDFIHAELARLGVQTKPYYAPVLHHTGLAEGPGEPLPVTEQLAAEALALPISSEMTIEEAECVAMALDRVMLRHSHSSLRPRLVQEAGWLPPDAVAAAAGT